MEIAYKTLGVSPKASLETIRRKYKLLAKEMHPDKGGSEEIFTLIQQSYCAILKNFKKMQIDQDHNELKAAYSRQSDVYKPQVNPSPTDLSEKELFHRMFEEYRTPSIMDVGYGTTMTKSSDTREDINIKNTMKTFTIDKFNTKFNKLPTSNSKHVSKKVDVEPYHVPRTLTFTTLGETGVKDFSGNNDDKKSLHYTDYQKAHSTTRLVDPRSTQGIETSPVSLHEAKKKREKTDLTFTKEELDLYNRRVQASKRKEERRQKMLEKQDEMIGTNYSKARQIIQEYRASNRLS